LRQKADRFEERIVDEIYKVFEENDGSFYTSPTYDLTNSVERQYTGLYDRTSDLWKRCDLRFFWNWTILCDLIDLIRTGPCHSSFVTCFIQGFIQTENILVRLGGTNELATTDSIQDDSNTIKLYIISRRNRHRMGKLANYVASTFFVSTDFVSNSLGKALGSRHAVSMTRATWRIS
jgi:hypothetical protein